MCKSIINIVPLVGSKWKGRGKVSSGRSLDWQTRAHEYYNKAVPATYIQVPGVAVSLFDHVRSRVGT